MEPRLPVRLTVRAYETLLPVATGFVEKCALAFGLGQREALALTLATEEVFLYLCRISAPETELEIQCRFTGYCVETEFVFEAAGFQMKAFNLTATPSFEDETVTRETGLLIASHLVDRFHLGNAGPRLRLTIVKDKAYPEADPRDAPQCVPVSQYVVRRPDGEEVKTSVRMVRHYCQPRFVPLTARFPGKVADIFAAGELDAAVAMDTAGHIGGILFWTRSRGRVVDCFGPYIFHPDSDPEMAALLLERCLEEIARTGAVGLINRYSGAGLPPGYFEVIGSLDFFGEDGAWVQVEAYYRQLGEDKGTSLWAHPDLVPFLSAQYDRLTLPREIRYVTSDGEQRNAFSVLSAEMDRARHWAVLRPFAHGEDAATVLADHVRLLEREGFRALFFEMDLKNPWEAHFTPALFGNGFDPRVVLPYGSRGDLVMFQYRTHDKV